MAVVQVSRTGFGPPLVALVLGGLLTATGSVAEEAESLEQREKFFESQVRPLLVQHCVDCHGPSDQSGQLRLDRRPAQDRSVGSGPIIVAGQPEDSLLMRAVRYDDSALQMPPDGKLSDEELAILARWVQQGAYWPEEADVEDDQAMDRPPAERIDEVRQSHWAYRPIASSPPPPVDRADWVQQPLDQFVLGALEQAGIAPSPAADRRSLIRRAYFTLIGLPPSYEEVEAFAADDSSDAFPRLIDQLLDNRHYGERWARHWLDLARYAETTGYLAGSADTTYPYAYTYRDYVINAFNEDKPFDRFVLEQIAADQLELPEDDQSALAALGFLTVGRKFMNRTHDIIDDRIDVVTRGFLAMSVACARCHDHKYDPIPIADYYSLYGVFASCREPSELPLLGDPVQSPLYEEFLAAKAEKQQEVDQWLENKRLATLNELRSRVADYLSYLAKTLPNAGGGEVEQKGSRGVLRPPAIKRWRDYLAGWADKPHPVWSLWHRLAAIEPDQFSAEVAGLLHQPSEELVEEIYPGLWEQLRATPPQSMVAAAEAIGSYLESTYQQWQEALKQEPALTALPDEHQERLRAMLFADDSPTTLDTGQMQAHLDQAERNEYNRQLSKVKAVESQHPGAPGRAMVLVDQPKPHEPVIFLRGQPGNNGDRVPRRFLQVLSHVDGGQPFAQGSGRLELAQAIASPDNPLTARVIVNRIWQHHFGFGLVRTASDFGFRGEPPTHPELLDALAAEFIADGWSIKRLQRRIMLSATWQQSSHHREEAHRLDPENRLLWRMPRKRLEFEPLRDRLLVAAGQLDLQIGGRSVMVHQDAKRRGLYAYIDREDVPGLLASFDLPSPDASQAIRSRTTVPQQALYLINSPFVIGRAEALAELTADSSSSAERITALYRRALSRDPSPDELELALRFVDPARPPLGTSDLPEAADESAIPPPTWQYGYGYVDEQTEQVHFTPLPHFTGRRWQVSADFPDPSLRYVSLTADGGHPGDDQCQATILRWIAPADGVVGIRGTLSHGQPQGDGVRGRVVSSRLGQLGSWLIADGEVSTRVGRTDVQAGDTLDFIVDCLQSPSYDTYQWAPVVRALRAAEGQLERGRVWNAAADFAAASQQLTTPAGLDPWVQLAQVLLVSNEFAFVD